MDLGEIKAAVHLSPKLSDARNFRLDQVRTKQLSLKIISHCVSWLTLQKFECRCSYCDFEALPRFVGSTIFIYILFWPLDRFPSLEIDNNRISQSDYSFLVEEALKLRVKHLWSFSLIAISKDSAQHKGTSLPHFRNRNSQLLQAQESYQ